jgi:hypothetical protein
MFFATLADFFIIPDFTGGVRRLVALRDNFYMARR